MKAKHCDECKHFDEDAAGNAECIKGHRPRFYAPKGVCDTDYGYKRNCDDYQKEDAK